MLTILGILYKWITYPFVSSFLSFILVFYQYFIITKYSTVFICHFDICFSFKGLLGTMLLWTLMCKFLTNVFNLVKYITWYTLSIGLGHAIAIEPIAELPDLQFLAVSFYNPTSNGGRFQFFHIIASTFWLSHLSGSEEVLICTFWWLVSFKHISVLK
jgi:hypothetical protein